MEAIKELDKIRGSNGTSLVSLYIPPSLPQLCKAKQLVTGEISAASNIKDRSNRQAVLEALKSIQNYISRLKILPNNGLAIFCGEGDIVLIEPALPIGSIIYRCGRNFWTQPLWDRLQTGETYGFIILDGNGALFGQVSGPSKAVLGKLQVNLPNKHGRGGQSASRFARLRL